MKPTLKLLGSDELKIYLFDISSQDSSFSDNGLKKYIQFIKIHHTDQRQSFSYTDKNTLSLQKSPILEHIKMTNYNFRDINTHDEFLNFCSKSMDEPIDQIKHFIPNVEDKASKACAAQISFLTSVVTLTSDRDLLYLQDSLEGLNDKMISLLQSLIRKIAKDGKIITINDNNHKDKWLRTATHLLQLKSGEFKFYANTSCDLHELRSELDDIANALDEAI